MLCMVKMLRMTLSPTISGTPNTADYKDADFLGKSGHCSRGHRMCVLRVRDDSGRLDKKSDVEQHGSMDVGRMTRGITENDPRLVFSSHDHRA